MKILSDLEFLNSSFTLNNFLDFPRNPKLGQIIFKNDGLFIYAENIISGQNEWLSIFDLTKVNISYIHNQDIPALTWNINHNLGSQDLFAVIYDENNVVQIGGQIEFIDNNSLNLTFVNEIQGRAILFIGSVNASPNNFYTKDQIDALLENNNKLIDYSKENIVGKWNDNSLIYKSVISLNGPTETNKVFNLDLSNLNIKDIIEFNCYYKLNGNLINANHEVIMNKNSASFYTESNSWLGSKLIIIIEYTKEI